MIPSSSSRRSIRRTASGPTPRPLRSAEKRISRPARPGPAGASSAERAVGTRVVVDDERQARIAPPRIQAAFDRVPLLREAHSANRTLAAAMAKVEAKKTLPEGDLRDVLREMLLIRRFEEKVEERFRAGELPGFLHVAIGQEACAVGVCRALEDGDVIASTHRAHGHTLAKGTHPNELMAELYGKAEGCSHGYGGSMHLYDVERGNLGANAVIGGGLPHDHRRGARVPDARRAARRGRVLRRRRDEHRHVPRGAQPRPAVEGPRGLRARGQQVGRVDARVAALADPRPLRAREGVRHEGDEGRRAGRRGGVQDRARRRSSTRARARAPCSSTSTRAACTATTSATRRSTATKDEARKLAETRDPITLLRDEARHRRTRSSTSSTPR